MQRGIWAPFGLLALVLAGSAAAEPVATVGSMTITREQLEAHVKPQLIELDSQRFDVLQQGLDELVADDLLAQEAKTRGVTVDALVAQEITAKVAAPPPEEVQKLYDANKDKLGGATLEQTKDRIVEFLTSQAAAQARENYVQSLKAKYKTTVLLRPPVIAVGDGGRPARGPATARVTIIEFSDYECPYCKRAEEVVNEVVKAYGDKVRFVYRDYPLPFHANARPAAEAAACAEGQGKFWEYHAKLFAAPNLTEATLKQVAGEVGLNQAKFDECLAKSQFTSVVEKDIADATAVGVRGTPAFFVNGRMLSGAQPFEKFKEIIDQELASGGAAS
jgi:protein-disulfide isomerase